MLHLYYTIHTIYIYIILEKVILAGLIKEVVHFGQLRQWQKTDVNRRLLIDFLYYAS